MDIIHTDGMLWTPVRVKARREKKLAEYCVSNYICHYLPLRRSVKRYGRRTFEFFVPMFTGYIFCQLDEALLLKIKKADGFYTCIRMDDITERKLIEDLNDIRIIEKASIAGNIEISPELVSGRKVRICGGPLEGITGYVEKRKDKLTIGVNLEILGQSVSVTLDVGDVRIEE